MASEELHDVMLISSMMNSNKPSIDPNLIFGLFMAMMMFMVFLIVYKQPQMVMPLQQPQQLQRESFTSSPEYNYNQMRMQMYKQPSILNMIPNYNKPERYDGYRLATARALFPTT